MIHNDGFLSLSLDAYSGTICHDVKHKLHTRLVHQMDDGLMVERGSRNVIRRSRETPSILHTYHTHGSCMFDLLHCIYHLLIAPYM